jgi:hypothetical protein
MALRLAAVRDLRSSLSPYSLIPLAVAVVILWFGLPAVFDAYDAPAQGDLLYIIDGGNVITDGRPDSLYRQDQASKQEGFDLSKKGGYYFPFGYPYTPTFALAMVPLAKMDDEVAARIWQGVTAFTTLVLAGMVASAFRGWSWRLFIVAMVVCWEPLLLNARIGQTGALVAGASAVGFVVFLRNRDVGAVLMGLLAFKPTAAIAPFFLIFPERLRVWVRFYGTIALIALVPFIWLGPQALFGWIEILTDRAVLDLEGGHVYNQGLSAVINLKNPVGVFIVASALLLVALLVSSVEARLGIGVAAALTIFLALLLNPHSLLYDWGVAFAGVMLVRSGGLFPEKLADAGAGAMAVTLFGAGQLVWNRYQAGDPSHLLTGWTVIVVAGLILLAFRPTLSGLAAKVTSAVGKEPAPTPSAPPVGPAPSRRQSRRKRRQR